MRAYNIFISHRWLYNGDYVRLVGLLDAAPGFFWRNYSVPWDDPLLARSSKRLRDALHNQMRLTHVVLTIAGVYASRSDWMMRELELANDFRKPIVAIAPWGSRNTSVACRSAATTMVNWSTASIIRAIAEYAL